MAITARKLAQQLGLSEAAVSLALNNKPGVSEETRRLVIEAATKQGYDFRRVKERRQKIGRICLLTSPYYQMATDSKPIFDDIIEGARQACKEQGYRLDVMQLKNRQLDEMALEETLMDLRQKEFDGILLLGSDMPKDVIRAILNLRHPAVLIDAYHPDLHCSAVTVDNINGGRLAARYLCNTYRQEPWYLKCRYQTRGFNDRIESFMSEIRDLSYVRRRVKVLLLSPSEDGSHLDLLAHLNDDPTVPRCIFAETDQIAMGAIRALTSRGHRVPEDVAVLGFDNIPRARTFDPPLTTIDYPKAYMGIIAVHKLLGLIAHPTEYVTNTQVAVSMVVRGSA